MSNQSFSPSLLTLPVEARLINILTAYKLTCIRDVEKLNAEELSKEVHISEEEAASILSAVQQITDAKSIKQRIKVTSLGEILERQERVPHQLRLQGNELDRIATNCTMLDGWMSGGIPLASLTELYGGAGIGKTQLCLQLCVNVQKPRLLGGLQGEALFIDGEGCLRTRRLIQIANAALTSWQEEEAKNTSNTSVIDDTSRESFSLQSILENIHYLRILDVRAMTITLLYQLDEFLSLHPKIRLIVLDGLSYQFRYDTMNNFTGYHERDNLIQQITHKLRYLAHSRNVSFVISNQVSHAFDCDLEKPALGQIWSRACATKLYLHRKDRTSGRSITLVKSQSKGRATFDFALTAKGVEDLRKPF